MDFKKRLKLAGGCAVASAFLVSFLFLFLSESLRSLAFTSFIAAAVIFVVCLILIFVLEGKPSKVRIPVFAAVIVAGMIALFSVTTYEIGVRMTFRPHFDEECYDELSDMEGKVEQISVDGISGWRLFATDVPADKPRPVILYFGGNGEDSSRKIDYLIKNNELSFLYSDYDFIYLDYPGYGLTEGSPGEESLREFALKAYEIVSSLPTTDAVTVLSYSLGNGPAVYLASSDEVEIRELILLAPYNSGYDLYNSVFNVFYGPMRLLVAYKMPVYQYASNVTCPVTIIASSDDEVIPIESSRELFSAFTGASTNFVNIEGVLHNDFWTEQTALEEIEHCLEG